MVGIPQASVREYVGGPVQFTLKSGTVVALTGRCTRGFTLDRLSDLSIWRQRILMARHWCETEPLRGAAGWIDGSDLIPR
jgi:hypothetical protein